MGKEIHVKQVEFETHHRYNAQGFRDKEIPGRKKQVKRLLFVGDSFVEGFGVQEESRFSNRLVDKLGKGYEGINVGQLATNPNVYLDNIEKFGIGLQPDAIVMGVFLGNDFMGGRKLPEISGHKINMQVSIEKADNISSLIQLEYVRSMWTQVRSGKTVLIRKLDDKGFWELFFKRPVNKDLYAELFKLEISQMDQVTSGLNQFVVQGVYAGMMHTGMFEEAIKHQLGIAEDDPFYTDEDYEKTFACILEADRIAREHKIQFVVLIIPDINQVHPVQYKEIFAKDFLMEKIPTRLKQLVELHGRLRNDLAINHISFVDPTDALKRSDSLTYYQYDNHMNSLGHEIVSEVLLPELRRLLTPVPEEEHSPTRGL